MFKNGAFQANAGPVYYTDAPETEAYYSINIEKLSGDKKIVVAQRDIAMQELLVPVRSDISEIFYYDEVKDEAAFLINGHKVVFNLNENRWVSKD